MVQDGIAAVQKKQLAYAPWKLASSDKQELLRTMYAMCADIESNAKDIESGAMMLYSKTSGILTSQQRNVLQAHIDKLTLLTFNLKEAQDDENDNLYIILKNLKTAAFEFLTSYEQIDLAIGGSFAINVDKSTTPWDQFIHAWKIKGFRLNQMGFPIHYTQDIFARFIQERIFTKDMDFTCLVIGRRGTGKSTYTTEVASTYSENIGIPFGLDSVVLTENADQMFTQVKEWKPRTVHQFDEAINQLFSRDFYKGGDFISLLTEIRYKNTVNFFLIPELYQIDKIMRDGLADCLVNITDQGTAVVTLPNLVGDNRFSLPDTPKYEVVISPDDLTKLMLSSPNAVTLSLFNKIPDDNPHWRSYKDIKNRQITTRESSSMKFKNQQKMNSLYYAFLVEMMTKNPDKQYITAEELLKFSEKEAYQLSFDAFVRWVAANTGLTWKLLVTDIDRVGPALALQHPILAAYTKKLIGAIR